MSAISAFWSQAVDPPARAMIERMVQAQAMYGGLRAFSWAAESGGANIALGGNLMHLLPEDTLDRQPLWSADGSTCLVADVRLDNRADLARELSLTSPETLADSDILLAAWMRWGAECLDHILGGFAFAVWTPARQELFAARDHTGERPIFFHRGKSFFALASMPKGLLAIPGVFQGFDEQRTVDLLLLSQPEWNKSYYRGIERLPLGHFLRVTPGGFECRRYWHPCDAKPIRFRRDEDYVEALLEIFDKAVGARLRTPFAVGSQLSSGLDSSSVTASAALRLLPQGKKITSFTSVPRPEFHGRGLPGRLPYEGPGAADVAAFHPNIEHVQMDYAGLDLLEDMKAWTDAMDEPAKNCVNLLWIWALTQEAKRRGIGVMLVGTAGNATVTMDGREEMTYMFRRGEWLKLYRLARNLRSRGEVSYKASVLLATNGLLPMWMKTRVRPAIRLTRVDYAPVHPAILAERDALNSTIQRVHGDLPDMRALLALFFERFDPAPMNAAMRARGKMDNRDPMADKRLFEFCFNIPMEQFVAGAQSRSLVRRAMKGRLPEATLARTIRGQQGPDWYLPVGEALPAFKTELGRIAESPVARRVLDLDRLNRLIDTWPAEGHETAEVTDSWNLALTRGIAVGYMLRERDSDASPAPGNIS